MHFNLKSPSREYFTCSQRSCQAKPQTFSAICSSVYTAPFCCGSNSTHHDVGAQAADYVWGSLGNAMKAKHRRQAHRMIMGLMALVTSLPVQVVEQLQWLKSTQCG